MKIKIIIRMTKPKHPSPDELDISDLEVLTSRLTLLQGDISELSSEIVGSPSFLRHLF